ncbi:MAG: 2-amino-4-hydroxy-6-hydroxymethyldihydropteridine diphosphokinase [Dongiaceae bacterium]
MLDPILIAVGANLPSPEFGPPRATCEAALEELSRRGLGIVRRSRWFETAPIPASDQPWFVNGVAAIHTARSPEALLALLHEMERRFGRERRELNAARILDLDIVAYGDLVRTDPPPILPHPRMHERAFVLLPLADVAPDWRHPADGRPLSELLRALPSGQLVRPVADDR